jgi:hypothetical protein
VAPRDAGMSAAGAAVACPPGDALAGRVEEIARAAEVMRAEVEATLSLGCFSGATVEALVHTGDRVIAVGAGPGPEPGALRRLAVHGTLGISFAAPLDVDGDGRSEIAVVEQAESEGERQVKVEILRLENNRFTPLAGGEMYRLSERSAAWVGAHLPEIELLVELRAVAGDVLVSGLYVHRGPAGLDTVAPLVPTVIELRRKRPGAAAEAVVARPRPGLRPEPGAASGPAGEAAGAPPDASSRQAGPHGHVHADDTQRQDASPAP